MSNEVKRPQSTSKTKNKNVLKGGATCDIIEINEHYLYKILDNSDCYMEVAIQLISDDKIITSDTVQGMKDFNSQSLSTQAKKGEQLVSMMPAIKKAFSLMGDDIVELFTENEPLKSQIGDYDQRWLEESKPNILKQIDDDKRANLIMSRMKRQMEKH